MLLMLLFSVISQYVSADGGIRSMDAQVLISTVGTLLSIAVPVALPLWNHGLSYSALALSKNETVSFSTFTGGFRRWFALIACSIMRDLYCMGFAFCAAMISLFLLSQLPFSEDVINQAQAFYTDPFFPVPRDVVVFSSVALTICAAAVAFFILPAYYSLRMCEHCVLDNRSRMGLRATLFSRILMQGRRWKLFFLDLKFWWFYAGECACALLALLGVWFEFDWMPYETSQVLFIAGAIGGMIALYGLAKPKMSIAYALFYREAWEEQAHARTQQAPPTVDAE